MGKYIFLLFVVCVGLIVFVVKTGFIDFSEVIAKALGSKVVDVNGSEVETEAKPTRSLKSIIGKATANFPLDRTLVDSQGRPLKATVLGKSNGALVVKRSSDGRQFQIPLANLSANDQQFFSSMPDRHVEIVNSGPVVPANRVARWNTDMSSARREAQKYNLPIYLVFTGTSWCPPCQRMEKEVFNSSEFRTFSNRKLVLMKVVVPASRKISGLNSQLSTRFDIRSYPTILLLDSNGNDFYKKSGASTNPGSHVSKIEGLIASAK